MYKFKESLPLFMLVAVSCDAAAYIGPGLGVGAIGMIIGIIVSVFLALFAVLWYPIKRFIKMKRSSSDKIEDKATSDQE